MTIMRYKGGRYKGGRYWALYDAAGALVCLCVYRKGAEEVRRRLTTGSETINR